MTTAGLSRPLGSPFFVLATQNPIEMEGTYPLPEAQLDRFFFKLRVAYPEREAFEEILRRTTEPGGFQAGRVFSGQDLLEMHEVAVSVAVPDTVRARVVDLVMATHPETGNASAEVKRFVRYGASPRAGQALLLAAKIRALLAGRLHVATEDVLAFALPALRHRVLLNFEAQAEGRDADAILEGVCAGLAAGWGCRLPADPLPA